MTNMPYSLIREKSGLAVAFELLDPSWQFTHQYVMPEHRRKGLGNAIERDLCQKCIR